MTCHQAKMQSMVILQVSQKELEQVLNTIGCGQADKAREQLKLIIQSSPECKCKMNFSFG